MTIELSKPARQNLPQYLIDLMAYHGIKIEQIKDPKREQQEQDRLAYEKWSLFLKEILAEKSSWPPAETGSIPAISQSENTKK